MAGTFEFLDIESFLNLTWPQSMNYIIDEFLALDFLMDEGLIADEEIAEGPISNPYVHIVRPGPYDVPMLADEDTALLCYLIFQDSFLNGTEETPFLESCKLQSRRRRRKDDDDDAASGGRQTFEIPV
jgi:hypothetical protein